MSPVLRLFRIATPLLPMVLLTGATTVSAADGPVIDEGPRDREIEAATTRAIEWIETHRATPQDGGLPDMIDEGVSFRVFSTLSGKSADRARFASLFRDQMAAINAHVEFQAWVSRTNKALIDHYHLVLAAHLTELAGHASSLIPRIREQAQSALATATFENPTVRLTTALFLSRRGEAEAIDIDALLKYSLIEQLVRDRQFIRLPASDATAYQRQAATWLLYALVHEVVALTDFGQLPPSPWLAARRAAVTGVLLDALTWASAENNMDLAAELAMTLYFLGQPLGVELQRALDKLLRQQQPDGSWGASPTTSRQNKVRHTVLTSAAALMTYRVWREQEKTMPFAPERRSITPARRDHPG